MIYDIKGNENYKLLPDILRRVKTRSSIKSSLNIFDTYDVRNGERPEDIAFKWFGDAELHWVILMTNNVTDNEDAIHHYEVTRDSGRTTGQGPNDYSHLVEVNSDTDNASSISNREYEERDQDKKRSIRLLDRKYLSDFIDEFNNLIAE